MTTSFPRVIVALVALAFVIAACASDSGSTWTAPPVLATDQPVVATAAPTATADVAPTAAPAESSAPAESAAPPAGGEPRVIALQADSALRFTDTTGQPLTDIPVVPGETVRFQIENTAGFAHNFYIGTDAELSVPAAVTEAGVADWSTGVQEFDWVVPDDIADLKFACTVPGHYFTMQGTVSAAEPGSIAPAEAPAEPEQPAEPAAEPTSEPVAEPTAETEAPAEPGDTATSGEARVIELEADAAIRFLQDGQQILNIDVTPGETVLFRVDNTAGFPHNFYIGNNDELQVMAGTTEEGIPDWDTGVQELEWVVPDDLTDVRFACTVPGHYFTMNGDFTVSP